MELFETIEGEFDNETGNIAFRANFQILKTTVMEKQGKY